MALLVRSCLVLLIVGCGASRREQKTCGTTPPAGSPAQMTTKPGPIDLYGYAVTILPPESCRGATVIGMQATGPRRLVFPRKGNCTGRPRRDDGCDRVEAHVFATDVRNRLEKQLQTDTIGVGLGGCAVGGGDVHPDTGAGSWGFVIHLTDWSHADAALATIADRMRAWKIGGTFGISVNSSYCGEAG